MLKRLTKVIASITATAVVVVAVLTIAAVVGQRYSSQLAPSVANADIYVISDYRGDPMTCHRDNSGFTVLTDEYGEILETRPVSSGAELKRCIEAFESGSLPFDPRNFIGHYEAGYVIWEGVDHQNIYHWDVPDECAPHYQFKKKSHPWLVDAFGLVDTIEVTFAWTGTDTEWNTCFAARLKQIAEIDPSAFEIEIPENSQQASDNDDSNGQLMTVAEPVPDLDGATVMLNPSITNRVPSRLSGYSADIVRNGVLIREESTRPGDIMSADALDATTFRILPTDGDECATVLQRYADDLKEIAEKRPGWILEYVLITDEDTDTLRRCSIPRAASDE